MEKILQSFSQQRFPFVCFWWNVYRSALVPRNLPYLEKCLAAHLHEKITLKSMSQTKEKYDSLVLSRSYLGMVWRCHGIPRVHRYHFCLEPMVRKETWMRMTSSILKFIWSQLCSEFLLNNYKPHLKQHFKKYPTLE